MNHRVVWFMLDTNNSLKTRHQLWDQQNTTDKGTPLIRHQNKYYLLISTPNSFLQFIASNAAEDLGLIT